MKTNYSKSVIVLLLSLGVYGCGGSDDSTAPPVTPPVVPEGEAYIVRAIDGYLSAAEVHVDRNLNNRIDAGEYVGDTDVNGDYAVTAEDSKYPLIIRAVGGVTVDSDLGGRVTATYELMSGGKGEAYITPFSTLAHLRAITVNDLAVELGYDADVLASDYVEAASDEASEVHLLARSTVKQLGVTIGDTVNDITTINEAVTQLPSLIDDMVNSGDDLDKVVITKALVTLPMVGSVGDFVNRNVRMYHTNFNYSAFEPMGIEIYDFTVGGEFDYVSGTGTVSYSSTIASTGNTVTDNETLNGYDFIYMSAVFGISIDDEGYMDLWTEMQYYDDNQLSGTEFSIYRDRVLQTTKEDFFGKSLYWLRDASKTTTPDLQIITIEFLSTVADVSDENPEVFKYDCNITSSGIKEACTWLNNYELLVSDGATDPVASSIMVYNDHSDLVSLDQSSTIRMMFLKGADENIRLAQRRYTYFDESGEWLRNEYSREVNVFFTDKNVAEAIVAASNK